MNSDCWYSIGSTHRICQDYAVASPNGDYVLLSDGCSSALDTDIGARLLVKSVQAFIGLENSQRMIDYGLARADACIRGVGLPRSCLAATLLIARKRGDAIETVIVGDGVVAAKRKEDGALFIYEYKYESGAPSYLSYTLDDSTREYYYEIFDQVRKCSLTILQPACLPKVSVWTEDASFFTGPAFPLEDFDLVALFSDGVTSFSREAGLLPLVDVVQEFTAFKNYQGQFVQRRCRRALDQFQQNNRSPADDLSMGAIAMVDEG